MRQYRGKRLNGKGWVYGWYSEYTCPEYGNKICTITDAENNEHEVDPKTVGQFIVKTVNSIDVYEKHKVLVTYGKHYNNPLGITKEGIVFWEKKTASFRISIKNSKVTVGFSDIIRLEITKSIYSEEESH